MSKKKKEKLDEGMVMISTLLPAVGGVVGLVPKREDNFVFKGLPGQFDEDGNKVLDEYGQPIKELLDVDTIHTSAKYKGKLGQHFPIKLTSVGDYTQMGFGFGDDSSWLIKLKGNPKDNEKKAVAAADKAFAAFEKEMAKLGKIEDFK